MNDTQNYIGGEYVDTGSHFPNTDPATGRVTGEVSEAGQLEVDRAVSAAKSALGGPWGKLTREDRANALHRIADEVEKRFPAFLEAEILDTGKPIGLASKLDIPRGAGQLSGLCGLVRQTPTEFFSAATPDGAGAINYTVRKPRGVVAVVCPWNLPMLLMTWKVAPALACGNTIVAKPSEETPRTATLLGEAMKAAGIPDGVYNVVHGFGPDSAGEYLVSHPDVAAVTFTGESITGEAIMKAAAVGIRPVSFELGGKNPGIVFADADLEPTLDTLSQACFLNAGQICLQIERLYVERPVFEQVVDGLKSRAKALRAGEPTDERTTMGPVISAVHRDKILSYFTSATSDGANVTTGGGLFEMPKALRDGYWIEPTIWTGLPRDAEAMRDEIFGPVVHIEPFDEEEDAIQAANDGRYGLAGTVFTQNVSRAHRAAAALDVGITWVNTWFLRDLRTAFGGVKQSGIGREGGVHSLEFYTELQNICLKL